MSKHRKQARHSQQNHTVDSITRLSYGRCWSDCEYEQLEHETNWKRHHRDDLTWNDESGRRAGRNHWYFRKPRNGWKDQTKRAHQYKPKDYDPVEKAPHSYHGRKRQPHNRYYWRNRSYQNPYCVIYGVVIYGRTCPISKDEAYLLSVVARERRGRLELDLPADYTSQDFGDLLHFIQAATEVAHWWGEYQYSFYYNSVTFNSKWHKHVVLRGRFSTGGGDMI